jgi:hypothetical protein
MKVPASCVASPMSPFPASPSPVHLLPSRKVEKGKGLRFHLTSADGDEDKGKVFSVVFG